jgi:gliding motility-associated-like protein
MNEVSQGITGNMEYVEFVVIDTTISYDCLSGVPPSIDIRGWIFDDNSGYHGAGGIATGAIRFSYHPMWAAVRLGTIILIYNDADPDPSIPAADISMSDGNCTIVAPISDVNLFESNATTPGAIACSYPAAGWTPGGNWSNTLLANPADCARIVNLAGCEVFSVCWGTDNLNTMIYFAGNAGNTVYYFNDNDPLNQANWSSGCSDNEIILDANTCGSNDQTPGMPNNAANASFISQFNNGCVIITPIVASAVVNNNEICGCDGQATASGSGSIPGYTYEWQDAAFMPIGQTGATAIGLCAGTYNVVVTSSIGCSDVSTVVISPGAAIPTVMDPADQSLCATTATTAVTFTGNNGSTVYNWTNDNVTIGLGAVGTGSIASFTAINSGSTTVVSTITVTPTLGLCIGASQTFTITVNPFNTVAAGASQTVCINSAITPITLATTGATGATVAGLPAGVTGSWAANVVTISGIPAASGPFTYTVNTTGGCPLATATGTITVTPLNTVATGTSQTVCINSAITPITLATTGATGATVAGLPAGVTGTWSANVVTISGTPTVSGPFTYTVTTAGGCPPATTTGTITVNPLPTFTVAGTGPTICNASDGSITISGLSNSTTYSVSYDDDGTSVGPLALSSDASGNMLISSLDAGTYDNFSITLIGCSGTSATQIILLDLGAPIITNPGNQIVCDTYALPGITGTNLSGTEAFYDNSQALGGVVITGPITSSQTVWIYDINGSCFDEEFFLVTVNNTPTITNPGAQVSCGTYALPVITGTNLSGNESYFNNSQALGGTVITGSITTPQTVWIYDTEGTCSDETSFLVTINSLPTVTTVTGGATYCAGDVAGDIEVDVTGSANWTINYTLDGVTQTATGSSSPINLGNAAGVYVVTNITDANCPNTASGAQAITINEIPNAPTAAADTTYCSSWTVVPMTATGSAGATFSWYLTSGLTDSPTLGSSLLPNDVLGTTVYYVTETLLGCEGPASQVTITIQDCEIIVPTAFTPDADGVNDNWEIVDLDEVYQNNVVMVYNRWGAKLYESEKGNYASKPWDGAFEGNALPVGSYYFIIDFNIEDVEPMKGIVSVILE